MFLNIFSFELKRWLKSWVFYLYLGLFFLITFFTMASVLGVFDFASVTTTSLFIANSPDALNDLVGGMNTMLYFLYPSLIGVGIYRDYRYNVHHILYSFPITKGGYLWAKFLSGFIAAFIITIFIGLAIYLATILPWSNQDLLGPNYFWSYAQVYIWNIIPNMLLIGVIVFAITTFSRSIYVGFVAVVVIIILQGIVNGLASDMDNKVLAALLDPTGEQALSYYTRYWTIFEANHNDLPIEKWFIVNRAIWLGVAILFWLTINYFFKFSQQPLSFGRSRKTDLPEGEKVAGLVRIVMSRADFNFSARAHWKNVADFAKLDYLFLVKNKAFLIMAGLGVLAMALMATTVTMLYGTNIYPVTRIMLLVPGTVFSLFIILITFLGAGLIVHRSEIARMNQLVDTTATPNWVHFASKFIALILAQATLLLVIMVSGILIQTYSGYYHFEIGLYLKMLLGLEWIKYVIWAGLAIMVQTIFKNYIAGFFVLLVFYLFGGAISKLGVEQPVFFFGRLPSVSYSDMDGFGGDVPRYYVYAFYWLLFTGFLAGLTLLFWRRGFFAGAKERFYYFKKRWKKAAVPTSLFLLLFLLLGGYLYYENKILNTYYSAKEREQLVIDYEKKFKQFENLTLPRITDISADVDLYPKERNFEVRGSYILENKHSLSVDTILVDFMADYYNDIVIDGAELLSKDTVFGVSFYRMKQPLDSGQKVTMRFTIRNRPNTFMRINSPILSNGTFINNFTFPQLGYDAHRESSDDDLRKKYGLPPKERMALQTDKKALQNNYISNDADWVSFETTVSTSLDQTAIAPGYLQKEWTDGNRRYFHYKMSRKMLNFFAYNSARYEVKKDKWNDVNIEIYYDKSHPYNLDRMINGIKKSLDYYTTEYSPYQHRQVRIIEFPVTMGSFAQSFANTIPFSEGIGFIADVDDKKKDAVDYPFSVTAHEVAHQWWAHQVISANVRGATMLSESLAEYSSLKVLEHRYGKGQMRRFLKDALDAYLRTRMFERKKEMPLMYNENQQYIHYNKGSLVFYAMSDYLGERNMNQVLKNYIRKVGFQDPPYTTAAELVEDLKEATPDSLKYLITDMFETITLYDNYIDKASYKKLPDGKYEVKINALASKYRSGEKGNKIYQNEAGDSLIFKTSDGKEIKSLPMNDYIEIGVFANSDEKNSDGDDEKILYLKKVRITKIDNEFTIITDQKPNEVGIDPYNKLIDTDSQDNRRKLQEER